MPLLGGAAIASAFFLGIAVWFAEPSLTPLVVGTVLMFILGLADDVRAIAPGTKLVGQMFVAGVIVSLIAPLSITGWPVIDQLLAFMWIIAITNAFNLLDNMDGLAAGVAALAGLCYLALLLPYGGTPLTLSIAAFVGAVLGFLVYNFPPASIFMGDGGSHLLGVFLATASLLATPGMKGRLVPAAIFPIFVLLVPIFDTAFVTLTRRLSGRRAMVGGRDHTSHRLVTLGASERIAVATLYALAAFGGLLAIALQRLHFSSVIVLVAFYFLILAVVAVVLGHVSHTPARTAAGDAPLVSEIAYRRRILELMLDIGLLTLAYYAAFRLRFQDGDASTFFPPFVRSVPWWSERRLRVSTAAGKYRQVWQTPDDARARHAGEGRRLRRDRFRDARCRPLQARRILARRLRARCGDRLLPARRVTRRHQQHRRLPEKAPGRWKTGADLWRRARRRATRSRAAPEPRHRHSA